VLVYEDPYDAATLRRDLPSSWSAAASRTMPIRRWLEQLGISRMQLDALRLRLLKVSGWVRQRLDAIRLHLASTFSGQGVWLFLATRPARS